MPCLTRMKFPGLTNPSTCDALSGVITSPGFTWALAGPAVLTTAIANASATTVENRLNLICVVPRLRQTCAIRPAEHSHAAATGSVHPRRREKETHKERDLRRRG